jgi:hypothetical protein
MAFNFSGKLNLEDYITFNQMYMKDYYLRKTRGKVIIGLFLFTLLAGIFLFADDLASGKDILSRASFYLIVFCVVFLLLMVKNIFFSKGRYAKYFNSNKLLLENHAYEVNDNSIKFKAESSSAELSKDKINKILYGKKGVYVFISLNSSYVIPSHFFKDEPEFESFKEFIVLNYQGNSKNKAAGSQNLKK